MSKRPLCPAPSPPAGGVCASRISRILCPIPKFVRYWCPARINTTAIARWWCAISVNQRLSVCGWNPPKKVRIAVPAPSGVPKMWFAVSGFCAYTAHCPEKNGASPAGCGNVVRKLSQRTCCPRDSGIATCTRCPVHARELTPKSPERWWLRRDSAFLNHESAGANVG